MNLERRISDHDAAVYLGIAAMFTLVFIVDYFTRLGLAEWILHVVPIGLCLFQRRAWLPLFAGLVATMLIVLGFLVSPQGAAAQLAAINRTIGVVTIWFAALIVRQTLLARARAAALAWLAEGQVRIAQSALGDLKPAEVGDALVASVARYVGAQTAVLYRRESGVLQRNGVYAASEAPQTLRLGEGVTGEAAKSPRALVIEGLPPDYLRIASATGSAAPQALIAAPITAEGAPHGVIELGFAARPANVDEVLALLDRVAGDVGVTVQSALYRERVLELLSETQRQGEELQAQQEELRVANEELTEQSSALKESQARLENQQAELEETNAQLEAQATDLERQKADLLNVQSELKRSAQELERASRYKSEFLANMSHELRTPLNSSLILAKVLADNGAGNLTEEQVNYAKVIHTSNNDLLALINDILDLSKIEAGHVKVEPEAAALDSVLEPLRASFEAVASEKGLELVFDVAADAPQSLTTDVRRLQQILRNLLSNALKFTAKGRVALRVSGAGGGRVAFAVEDTGIGIPEDQLEPIFEAFHQADGTTSRKYGGTGLGLSISRELARLLGGIISVTSTVGVGSTFSLTIPVTLDSAAGDTAAEPAPAPRAAPVPQREPRRARPATPEHIPDDREHRAHERLILIVDDDVNFARILYGLAHELDLDCIHTVNGSDAVELARRHNPSGILLDVGLPDDSGLSVLERLKRDPDTRHIPVHMLSVEDHTQPALELGAVGYTLKPAARHQLVEAIGALRSRGNGRTHSVLVVEDDAALRESIAVLLRAEDVEIALAGSAAEALERLSTGTFDCVVMDLALPDASGFDLLERIAQQGRPGDSDPLRRARYTSAPVIVYTGRQLSPDDEQRLRRYSRSIIIKGARSPERLLDEVTLFLHRVESTLPPDQQKLLRQARQREASFEGRTILLAEDDVRNIYALSSVLEPLGAKLEIARNGREALDKLANGNRIDLVLMDVMMPEMDGLAAMREIRKSPQLSKLPIIAITAKAMPEDRQACLDAGASDYVSKPIDVDKLLSLCRVWLPK
ncbi:MAG TPA: response regulator [Burkholderiales bacterium]|nr:response regulator [Burkholderiales bacterium]